MDTAKPSQTPKPQPLSCSECKRRKQRCNREWPCNHCQSRRVPQLCNYSTRTTSQPPIKDEVKGVKRGTEELDLTPLCTTDEDHVAKDTNIEIVAWGYMPDTAHFNLGSLDADGYTRSTDYQGLPFIEEVNAALLVVPPRALADILVQNFLYFVNNFYNCIYPPQFLDDYATWWTARKEAKPLSPPFTALLIRVLAYSAQYLSVKSRQRIESELGESVDVLARRYHEATEKLSRCFGPGKGGILHVQQQFLAASWWKSESQFVESWHALGGAIREAQEIGLHKDKLARRCTDFDMEMRRRLWCLLYVWDWQMSQWLSRPLLIDHKSCDIEPPNLRIDSEAGLPSPFTLIKLQYDMCYILAQKSTSERENVCLILDEIDGWMQSFPRVFSFVDPDTSRDHEFPYIKMQREYLHAMSYMFKLDPLKPCLTKSNLTEVESSLRPLAVDTCLKMSATAKRLFDIMWPESARSYLVICASFDPAALLTSAIIHDSRRTLPRKQEALDAIGAALEMLSTIGTASKTGSKSYGILLRLTSSIPELYTSRTSKRMKTDSSNDSSGAPSVAQESQATSSPGTWYTARQAALPTVSDFQNTDFGGLEDIWDWQMLNLAVLGPGNAPATFGPLDELVRDAVEDSSFNS